MTTDTLPRLIVTAGEPAGIGPDLCAMLAQHDHPARLAVIGDPDTLQSRAHQPGLPLVLSIHSSDDELPPHRSGHLQVVPVDIATPVTPGQLDPANAPHVTTMLATAVDDTLSGHYDALITAPVHKGIINDAGIPFSGHTEFFAERCSGVTPVMMLATPGLRVALATTHLPLRAVADAITGDVLEEVITILHRDLKTRFGLLRPRIFVCGLNPHAGEGGHLGREEVEIIAPTLERLRALGIDLYGPLPADTLFTPKYLDNADAVLAMYHDQGLPVLKHKGFGNAVNITLGLPVIRTSVDHGTALDLAGSGRIDSGSLNAAVQTAIDMVRAGASV